MYNLFLYFLSLYFRISHGCTFLKLEQFLADIATAKLERLKSQSSHKGIPHTFTLKGISWEKFHPDDIALWPSHDLLEDMFLYTYRSLSHLYKAKLEDVSASLLSMDHTFKVCSNIGHICKSSGKWITLYDSLIALMNEDGYVLGYKLTASTAFAAAEPLMLTIKNRLPPESLNGLLIIIDNCCAWKKKLIDVFGSAIEVKLDLFHAVQRITKTIPKHFLVRRVFLQDLRNVFRQAEDDGEDRKYPTPEPSVLKKNLEDLQSKYDKVEADGIKILNSATLTAISNLTTHIEKGCLSNIPPGAGTNQNERLHRLLNESAIAVSRIGPELANALLDVIFYNWNSRRNAPPNKTVPVLPISQTFDQTISESNAVYGPQLSTGEQLPLSTNSDNLVALDIEELHVIYHNTLSLTEYTLKYFPKFDLDMLMIGACLEKNDSVSSFFLGAQQQLCTNILKVGLEKEEDVEDNVLLDNQTLVTSHTSFQSAVEAVHQHCQTHCVNIVLLGAGATCACMTFIPNISTDNIQTHYIGIAGDKTAGYTLANLRKSEKIIDSVKATSSDGATKIAYDSNTIKLSAPDIHKTNSQKGCRCGKGSKKEMKTSCHNQDNSYSSRCPCLQSSKPCGQECRCVQCQNPHGSFDRVHAPPHKRQKRCTTKRPTLKRSTGQQYYTAVEGQAPKSGWGTADSVALYTCHNWGLKDKRTTTLTNLHLHELYSALIQKCCETCHHCPVSSKSKEQVTGKYKYIKDLMNAICNMWNC